MGIRSRPAIKIPGSGPSVLAVRSAGGQRGVLESHARLPIPRRPVFSILHIVPSEPAPRFPSFLFRHSDRPERTEERLQDARTAIASATRDKLGPNSPILRAKVPWADTPHPNQGQTDMHPDPRALALIGRAIASTCLDDDGLVRKEMLSLARIPSASVFIAFQRARVGQSK